MPIYEYRCPNGHVFEVFKSMSEPPPERCETCGAAPVQQVLYPVAVHYKGSGFYTHRLRPQPQAAAEEGGEGGGEKKSEGGDKPAEKKAAEA